MTTKLLPTHEHRGRAFQARCQKNLNEHGTWKVPPHLPSWVKGAVHLFEALLIDVGVDLGGGNVGVT